VRRQSALVSPARALALALALVVVASACGQAPKPVEAGAPPASPTTKAANPTTSAPPPPTFPLTGLPVADPAAAAHPVVVVKMDNSPDARPQAGINEADVVYELLVEGITRYALVFHSQVADPVGPVRSGRSSDPPLLANLARPLVAWSGGNPGVTGEILAAADAGFLVDAGSNALPGQYWRDRARRAPHNLYTSTGALLAAATPEGAGAPLPLFTYRAEQAEPAGVEAAGVVIDFGQRVRAEYVWDAERGGWNRYQVDENHSREESATVDGAGVHVAPQNVVILFVEYGQSPSDARSPMAISTGSGPALVLSAGRAVHGTWNRATPLDTWQLLDEAGQPIELTPGRTWVAMPRAGAPVLPLDQPTAEQLLALRR
jgi:hypothetical protein